MSIPYAPAPLDRKAGPGFFRAPMEQIHAYRTHTCGALRAADTGQTARLSGWVHAKRDHGGLLFIDLRDHYGLTQCVFAAGTAAFAAAEAPARRERHHRHRQGGGARARARTNPKLPTGEIELRVAELAVQSGADVLPMQVAGDEQLSRGAAAEIPLPRSAPRAGAQEHHAARGRDRHYPPPHDRGRVHRIPDADPDRLQPRRRARLPGARPHCIPASSTRCRRRRSSSSSC